MKNINFKKIAMIALIISIAGLSIAFASFTASLNINGTVTIQSDWSIIWTDMQEVEASGYATAGSLSITDNDTNVVGSVGTINAPGDVLTAKWYVSNEGEINAKTTKITIPTLSCTPSSENGASKEGATAVCNDLTLSISVEDWGVLSTGTTEYALDADESKLVTMTLTYSSDVDEPIQGSVDVQIKEMPMFEFGQTTKTEPSNCIVKGSKISLPNGQVKNIEDIKVGDDVLGYNYFDGNISTTKVYSIISGVTNSDILTVLLDNGMKLEIVGFEYLFDIDSKEFIPININKYKEAIGKNIMINDNGNISSSKVISITKELKEVEYYTMYTENINNYIANNMIVHIHVDFVNDIYTISDNLKVDVNKYNDDIKKYGLYTYDQFKEVCTKEFFDKFNLKDYSIVIGKGLITFDKLKIGVQEIQEEINFYNKIK